MQLMDGYRTQSLTDFNGFKGVIRYINKDQDGKKDKQEQTNNRSKLQCHVPYVSDLIFVIKHHLYFYLL